MIWQNAWAFVGMSALVLPLLIHLLSRKRASVQKFPSLRFLTASRLLPTRSPRLSDIWLLLVRVAILSAAVLALAQPFFVSTARQQAFNSTITRAIVVDTSASMQRRGANGVRAVDSARAEGEKLARNAATSIVVQTVSPTAAIAGVVSWLSSHNGRGDITLWSDFQTSSIDSADLASIPMQYGVHLVRTPFNAGDSAIIFPTQSAIVRVSADSTATSAEWSSPLNSIGDGGAAMSLYTGAADR
ncbi:MAG: BatA domain-containing protein, partial [Gemmatimonadota bacterium]|nr:BatA domain-containing protein [Gemmatimonadota bacterium]